MKIYLKNTPETFEEEILELIDNQNDFTRSDLQGVVTCLVQKIIEHGKLEGEKRVRSVID